MSSLFHRRPGAQAPLIQQSAAAQTNGPVPSAYQIQQLARPAHSLGVAVDLRQQGQEASRRLKLPYRHLLIEVAVNTLDGSYEPYEPPSAEAAQLAATLAHPSIGLLLPQSAGFVTCYSLTPLGGAVVRALLHEMLALQQYQQHQQPQTQYQAAPAPAALPWQEQGRQGGHYE